MREIRYIGDPENERPEPDIASEIWARVIAVHPVLRTAEQRADLDNALRTECASVADVSLRMHVESIIRDKRAVEFRKWSCDTRQRDTDETIADLIRRVRALEAK